VGIVSSRHDRAQITSRYIADLVRRRALAAIAPSDAALSKQYDKIAEGVRRDLRALGFTTKQVRAIIEKHFNETLEERVRIVETAIRDAAREGRKLDQETFDAVFGAEDAAAARPLAAPSSAPRRKRSLKLASESEGE
jgi:hypothetical protein